MFNPKPILKVLQLLVIVAGCFTPVLAQSSTATLSGTVVDENSAVIPGAGITVQNRATSLERQATTNDSGSFTIPLLPPGEYTVLVEREGFTRVQLTNIVLNVGDQKAVQVQLKVGDVASTVEVRADPATVRTDGSVGTVVDRTFVENIPLNGRSFQSLIALTPGVVLTRVDEANSGQFSANGQRASANYFTVDGVSANFGAPSSSVSLSNVNGSVPALTATGGTNSLVSVDALEEFKIITSTFAPEFGRQPGAQVSIVTRSGTKDFHGNVFEYFRNDALDATDWFVNANNLRRPELRQNDFGGTFSGPVLLPRFGEGGRQPGYNGRKRTFFFLSYEHLGLLLPQAVTIVVPSLALRQTAPDALKPILNAYPVPNGTIFSSAAAQFSASYSDPSTLNATSIRIDHTINEKATIFGRYNYSPSSSSARIPPGSTGSLSFITVTAGTTETATFGLTSTFTPRWSNEFRTNFSRHRASTRYLMDAFGGAIVPPNEVFFGPGADAGNTFSNIGAFFSGIPSLRNGANAENRMSQFALVDALTFVTGGHQLKFGVDLRRLAARLRGGTIRQVLFRSEASVRASLVDQFAYSAQADTFPVYWNYSAFAQDTWKASPRLTLTYGFRWDVNPPPSSADGTLPLNFVQLDNPATFAFAPAGTPLYKTRYTNFAPRFGMAYYVSQRQGRELVLRGGLGIFYDVGSGSASNGILNPPLRNIIAGANIPYPLAPAFNTPPPLGVVTFPTGGIRVVDPNHKIPRTYQWNVALEQSLGRAQAISASYVAAVGRNLTGMVRFNRPNANFTSVFAVFNKSTSDYHSLQLQFTRRLSRGLQALASYSWSHSIDDVSTEAQDFSRARANSDFDVRHNFSAALTYDVPRPFANTIAKGLLHNWSVDTIIHAQTANPLNILAGRATLDGFDAFVRPDLTPGIPLYIKDPLSPGGWRLNNTVDPSRPGCKGPFCPPPRSGSVFLRQGTLARNVLRGYPLTQVDLSLRRQFSLGEHRKLQLRAEMFNAFNHPNFANPNIDMTSSLFGVSTSMLNRGLGSIGLSPLYQVGGPRSIQLAIKFAF